MEIIDEHYHVLKKIKENEHRIHVPVTEGKREVDYRMSSLPPALWAARVLYYLSVKMVSDGDIVPDEPIGGTIASCGHRVKKVMWDVSVKNSDGILSLVVCPECYRRIYKNTCIKQKTKRITLDPKCR
jgi:hypothetical protein